ncbi:MAG: hypothetical protein ABIJ81_02380 [Patescibacteria group bacterium]
MDHYWFKSKQYGWGWTPASSEGWSVLALYFIALVLLFKYSPIEQVVFRILAITALLIVICVKTGEKPRWRWIK